MTPPTRLLVVLMAALAASGLLVACNGGGEEAADTTTTTVPPPSRPEDVVLEVRRTELVGPRDPGGPLPPEVSDGIVSVVQDLLRRTSAAPMLTGQPATGFESLLTTEALARAAGPDIAAFTENGVPANRRIKVRDAGVEVYALVGEDGAYQVAVADVIWDLSASGGPQTVDVRRSGEITLLPAPGGGWLISSYDVHVTRTLGPEPSTTTTTTTTATAGEGG